MAKISLCWLAGGVAGVALILAASTGRGAADSGDAAWARTGPFALTVSPGSSVGPYDVEFSNTGTTTWQSSEGYALVEEVTGEAYPLCASAVYPDPRFACDWRFSPVAPDQPGSFPGWRRYRMHHGSVAFGDAISVDLTVVGPTPTPTGPSASPTPTSTAAPSPPATGTPISTPTPTIAAGASSTATPTAAPAASSTRTASPTAGASGTSTATPVATPRPPAGATSGGTHRVFVPLSPRT